MTKREQAAQLLAELTEMAKAENATAILNAETAHYNDDDGSTTVMAVTGTLSLKKNAFTRAAKKEFKRLITEGNFFINLNSEVAGTHTINVSQFTNLITSIKVKTPLGQAALTSFCNNPGAMGDVQQVENLFSSILNLLYDSKWLKSHYDSNKATYLKEVKDITQEDATEEIFKSDIATDFANLIKTIGVHLLSSINDANYGPNKAKIEAAEKETEKRRAQFDTVYQNWLDQSINNVTGIDSSTSQKVLPKDVFIISANDWRPLWAKAQPQLTNRLLDKAINQLTKTDLSVAECAEALNGSLQDDYKTLVGADLMFNNWEIDKTLPNINGLISTINMVAGDDDQNDFNKIYIDWYKSEFDALDSLEWNHNDRFYKKKVLENLKNLLKGDDRAYMLPIFDGYFNNLSNIARVEDYIQEWKRGINDVIEISLLKKQYAYKAEKQNTNDKKWLDLINLPSEDEIHRLFDKEGKYIYIKPKAANGETVQLVVKLSDGSILNIQVPTNIKVEGNKAFATPTNVVLASQSSGSLGYKYSIAGLALENTSAHVNEGIWVTPFDFRINLEKDAGELSSGKEHTDETGGSFTHENTTTKGTEKGTITSVGGATTVSSGVSFNESATAEGGLVVVGGSATLGSEQSFGFSQEVNYGTETESKKIEETSIANAFEINSSSSDSESSGETFNKGVISGSFGLQISLTSTYILPAQDGNNATLEARLSLDSAPYPLSSKGCSISSISPGFKIMPATK